MNAREHYQAGQLGEAVTAALADVRKGPADADARGLLCELLCFAGDLERADKHLDALSGMHPDLALGTSLFRQLLRAEQARREVFEAGRVPELLVPPSPALSLALRAAVALRGGTRRTRPSACSPRPKRSGPSSRARPTGPPSAAGATWTT
jgi:type VI secretion system protein ImpE